jgi:hypothetical protein
MPASCVSSPAHGLRSVRLGHGARLTDAQAQVRSAILKQEVARIERIVLVLAETRHNRAALEDAAATVLGAFPTSPREVLGALRTGWLPRANGIFLV